MESKDYTLGPFFLELDFQIDTIVQISLFWRSAGARSRGKLDKYEKVRCKSLENDEESIVDIVS